MGYVEDVVEVVAAVSTAVTKGTNLFAHMVPETTKEGGFATSALPLVAVEEDPGLAPVERFTAGGLPAFDRPQVTIVVQSTEGTAGYTDPRSSRGLAHRIYNAINSHAPNSTASTSGVRYTMSALPPGLVERDQRGRYIFAMSVDLWADPTTST